MEKSYCLYAMLGLLITYSDLIKIEFRNMEVIIHCNSETFLMILVPECFELLVLINIFPE